ncbi:amidohydrolase [Kitasatospora sp. NE20-6]
MSGMLIRGAEVDGLPVDVRIRHGLVAAIAPALPREGTEAVVAAGGGALLPGLTDHHLHLFATAAESGSVLCAPSAVPDAAALSAALHRAVPDAHGWVRGVRYDVSVAGDLDAAGLDRLRGDVPVRVRHRSGALWVLNGPAVAAVGLGTADHPGVERDPAGRPTGRLHRADAWLAGRLPAAGPLLPAALGRQLADHGITAVTDAGPALDPAAVDAVAAATARGDLPQRVHLLGAPLGVPLPDPGPAAGPWRIGLPGGGLPEHAGLTAQITAAHRVGRPVAAHCATGEAVLSFLAAVEEAGVLPGDRIDHPLLVPAAAVPEIGRLGLRVVGRPGLIADLGDDYLRSVPPAGLPDVHRGASLTAAGVPLGLSSDAPYGPLDPWAVMRAAVLRRTRSGGTVAAGERLAVGRALAGYLSPAAFPGGPVRRVRVGVAADLVLLGAPLGEVLRRLDTALVRLTLIGGRPVGGSLLTRGAAPG